MSYDDIKSYIYFKNGSKGQESSSLLAELRDRMKQDGFIRNTYDEVTPELIEKAKDFYSKNNKKNVFIGKNGLYGVTDTRIIDFMRPTKDNFKLVSDEMNKLPALVPISLGLGTLSQIETDKFQQGGQQLSENEIAFLSEIAIKDNNGYWNKNNHGKVVEINSPNITMKNVNQDLIGIQRETGEKKIKKKGNECFFKNTQNVIELPIKK